MMFFHGWDDLLRIVIVGSLAYAGLILLQRLSGKRTLSKMNAFDLIVTVALGSALANVLLSKGSSLSEGLTAFAVLVVLQFLITSLSTRWKPFAKLIKSEPRLLVYQGHFLKDNMNKERVLEAEVRQAVRTSGLASMYEVDAVVLGTDGTFSVIASGSTDKSALADLELRDQ